MLVPRSFPVPKRVPTRVFAETPQRTNLSVPCRVTQVEKIEKNARWLTRGRILWTTSPYPPATSTQDSNLPSGYSRLGGCPLYIYDVPKEGAEKPAAGAVAYTLGGGHRTYAPRDEAPVHY